MSHFTGPCLVRSIRACSRKSRRHGLKLGVGELLLPSSGSKRHFTKVVLFVLVDELEGMDAVIGAVGVARRRIVRRRESRLAGGLSGWVAANALSASGFGLPVAGSGFAAIILSRNVRGTAGEEHRCVEHGHMLLAAVGQPELKAMPRGLFSVSAAFGFPPPSEKRATTGMVDRRRTVPNANRTRSPASPRSSRARTCPWCDCDAVPG